jgi:hypothetical protein
MLLLATKDARQWLISLICRDPAQASGACHRSRQLIHLLESDGWHLESLDPPLPPPHRWHTLRLGATAALHHGPLQPFGVDSLRSQGHCAHWVAELHRRFPRVKGVIQEGTGYGRLSALAEWNRRGVRTVAVPANLEALAPNTGSWTHRGLDVAQRFAHERRWWAIADAIFTISFEEAWWLQLHGIDAEWLPYYPAPEREEQLLAIRQARQPDQKVGWLWLADFRNPANRAGADLTVQWLKTCLDLPQQLVVAGRGCSWLRDMAERLLPVHAIFLGEVSDQQLDQLYRSCTAQLIVHPATSGALTRICDAAIAGIPIVGNSMARKGGGYFSAEVSQDEVICAREKSVIKLFSCLNQG